MWFVKKVMVSIAVATTLLALQSKPDIVSPRIVSVSMFRNGYAFVTRELPLKDGVANLVDVPTASEGSLWFWTKDGMLESVTAYDEHSAESQKVPFETTEKILSANIGKRFALTTLSQTESDGKKTDVRTTHEGVLRLTKGSLVGLETASGVVLLQKSSIVAWEAKDKDIVLADTIQVDRPTRLYKVKTAGGAKVAYMLSLEYGMAWKPGYAIDLSKPDKLQLTSKATLVNDLVEIQNSRVRVITGFPNVSFSKVIDPLTSRMSLDEWLQTMGMGNSNRGGFGGTGGGMGGGMAEAKTAKAALKVGSGLVPSSVDFITYDPTDNTLIVKNSESEILGDQLYYDLMGVTLGKGARSYQYLYQVETDYQKLYRWNGLQGYPVASVIKFKNPTNRPIAPGDVSIFNSGEITGQGKLEYVAGNSETTLETGKTLELKTTVEDEITDRSVGAIKDKQGVAQLDLVTHQYTLSITNPKNEKIKVLIERSATGSLGRVEPKADVKEFSEKLRGSNAHNIIKWEFWLDAGQSWKGSFGVKAYVPTGQ
ncbi:MAG: hypothetical protein WCK51_08385 [Armatimonadota bacterium]